MLHKHIFDGKFLILVTISVSFVLLAQASQAAPSRVEPMELGQPDGSTFMARQFGDEWSHHVETVDGYSIVQDPEGWWHMPYWIMASSKPPLIA